MTSRTIPLTPFDRIVDSFFSPTAAPRLDRQIPVDAVQREDRLQLWFDLPGVPQDAIELGIERRVLTVTASRPAAIEKGDHVFLAERPWGAMSRKIVLGDTLDTDRITASYDNGVLKVVVPVAERSKTRRIDIGHAPVEAAITAETRNEPEAD